MQRAAVGHPGADRIGQLDDLRVAEGGLGLGPEELVLRYAVRVLPHAFGVADAQALARGIAGRGLPALDFGVELFVGGRAVGVNRVIEVAVKRGEEPGEIAFPAKGGAGLAAVDQGGAIAGGFELAQGERRMLVGRGALCACGLDDGRCVVPAHVLEGAALHFGGQVDAHDSLPSGMNPESDALRGFAQWRKVKGAPPPPSARAVPLPEQARGGLGVAYSAAGR